LENEIEMNTGLSITHILYLLGAGQGSFLAFALFTSKVGNHKANNYLVALTLVFSIALIDYFLDASAIYDKHIWLKILLWPRDYLYGVLIYFYVRELIYPELYHLKRNTYLHFIPTVLQIIFAWSLFFLSTNRQIAILQNEDLLCMTDVVWEFILGDFELLTAVVSVAIYILLSFKLLRQHRIQIQDKLSYSENINLNWLRLLLISLLVVYFLWLTKVFISDWFQLEETFDIIVGLSLVLLIYSMGYLGLRQPIIFTQIKTDDSKKNHNETENKKYIKSSLSADSSKAFLKELQQLMQQEKPYLDNKLSLTQLANKMGISSNYLSQTINEQLKVNFFDFINSYRIQDAKERLENPLRKNENILTVAMDCGFNSKSAFYNAFRKQLGMTPSQYRKSLGTVTLGTSDQVP